jgi:hypothetical protein
MSCIWGKYPYDFLIYARGQRSFSEAGSHSTGQVNPVFVLKSSVTRAQHCTLFWARWIQSRFSHHPSVSYILILTSHLHLGHHGLSLKFTLNLVFQVYYRLLRRLKFKEWLWRWWGWLSLSFSRDFHIYDGTADYVTHMNGQVVDKFSTTYWEVEVKSHHPHTHSLTKQQGCFFFLFFSLGWCGTEPTWYVSN